MKLTPLLQVLRGAALIAAAGFIVVSLRGYLIGRWGLATSPQLYGVLGFLFIWTVASVSTRRLLSELRAEDDVSGPQSSARQFKASESRTETVHRYPMLLSYILAAFGLYFVALPYLSVEPGKSIALVTYAGCFGLAFVMFATALYMFIYSVTLKHDGIIVKAFGQREIAFSDVANTKAVRTIYGRQIVVTLKSGEVFRFGGKLADFSTLLDALTAQAPHRTEWIHTK